VFNDFNSFTKLMDKTLKGLDVKLSASEKNAIFGAVSWYDAEAEKVVKSSKKWSAQDLTRQLNRLGCVEAELPHFGYFFNGSEYVEYETESDLRDTENVPLKEQILPYFLREVKPHVDEAWINLEATKIGYEISFNKYFYQHKPLRSLAEVAAEIKALESESDGLINEILN
jgi:type I restriction enzyme M protein